MSHASGFSLAGTTKELHETLKRYLEAQYHIWNEQLVRERRALLDTNGVVCQPPYIEATPAYVSGDHFSKLALPPAATSILELATSHPATGVPSRPYMHQASALQAFLVDRKDLVVSTGTGSGKTESFLLPILGAFAIERAERATFSTPAVRALLLYPMNALVNDQLARLRRLFGNEFLAAAINKADGYSTTFGMYTSRTPYAGPSTTKGDRERVIAWIRDFLKFYGGNKEGLIREGKWPAKDLEAFEAALKRDDRIKTARHDRELISRHEMHARPPDILVTNYSMLEYMLLRPIEQRLFKSTEDWLLEDSRNRFIVVLDEAHMYQGAQGSEVGLLLRRLISRIRAPRDRVQFILTSASLAVGPNAGEVTRRFAAELTGASNPDTFAYITSTLEKPAGAARATREVAIALEAFDFAVVHRSTADEFTEADRAVATLATRLGARWVGSSASIEVLRDRIYTWLEQLPVACKLVDAVMGKATRLDTVSEDLFGHQPYAPRALETLVALANFAKRISDGRIFLPSRLHLLFRGLDGLFACTNRHCAARRQVSEENVLGKLYHSPRLRCECGSRVYELHTHRDCGAAFLKGYTNASRGGDIDFLWHEGSTGLSASGLQLTAVHLLVEVDRVQVQGFERKFLHTATGRCLTQPHPGASFLEIRVPREPPVFVNGESLITFPMQCPVCSGIWRDKDTPTIMDHVTKGEAPLAHLIAKQVSIQPPTRSESFQTPNAGRKSLIFSDGRQKAARLARDLPREVERDAFRQALLLAARDLEGVRGEARLADDELYPALIGVANKSYLTFFDGNSADRFGAHQQLFIARYKGDLRRALEDGVRLDPPESFYVQVLRALGSRNYSLFALALAYARPRRRVMEELHLALSTQPLDQDAIQSLSTIWIQGMLGRMAMYSEERVDKVLRRKALGYPVATVGASGKFERSIRSKLNQRLRTHGVKDISEIETAFQSSLCEQASDGGFTLRAAEIGLTVAVDSMWFGCPKCTHLSPVRLFERCAHCGSDAAIPWTSEQDYLRARKSFWREPMVHILKGEAHPLTLNVQEHTAQLGYRDVGAPESTTEEYERRFRDILLSPTPGTSQAAERSIDVLSCTTTMEVGIDIGSLTAVALRNMPPSRHNYQQRAGRSGRRGSAVSTVVTYAQSSPHDSHLFEHPVELISGQPRGAGLDVHNSVLVRRHVYAELLQEFFRETTAGISTASDVFSTLGRTEAFYVSNDSTSFNAFRDWLDKSAEATLSRIARWIPKNSGVDAKTEANTLIQLLEAKRQDALSALPHGEDKLIEFLFARGVLPAYAFPRDLITLEIQKRTPTGVEIVERMQQSASIALSEYAPGRRVVVNKRTYRIGAVSASPSGGDPHYARSLFNSPPTYLQCVNCLHTKEVNAGNEGELCAVCERANLEKITALQPQIVWPEESLPLPEEDDDEDRTETTIAQLPVPSSDLAFSRTQFFGQRGELRYGPTVKLIKVNRGRETGDGPTGFHVCTLCGHATLEAADNAPGHARDYILPPWPMPGKTERCQGQARRVYLGYEFATAVLLMRIKIRSPLSHDLTKRRTWPPLEDALVSLAEALAIAGARHLEIDVRELQAGHRLLRTQGDVYGDVYLYDTLAGGAGYAKRIGELFPEVFATAKTILANCSGECAPSCSKCLRVYSNRFLHDRLDRRLGFDLARYVETGEPPSLMDRETQQLALKPLVDMLSLAGWDTDVSGPSALVARRDGVARTIGLIPSLWDPNALPKDLLPLDVTFRLFDIERDLPSCLRML